MDLLGSAVIFTGIQTLWSNLTIIHLHKMAIYSEYASLKFTTHPFLLLFLFYNYTHTKSYSGANRCVCIVMCKYDSSSCVCVRRTCSRLLSLSSCDLTDEQSSATCLKVSSSSTTVWLSCWTVGWRGRWPVRQAS